MKKTLFALVALCSIIVACDDTTDTIGNSLINTEDILSITTDTFDVTSRSVYVDYILTESTVGYLGITKDPETGSYLKCDMMTQFHTFDEYEFPAIDSLVSYAQTGEVKCDSAEVRLYCETLSGDSMAPMKCTLYEMAKPIQEDKLYYSNFDAIKDGYVRTEGTGIVKKEKTFSIYDLNERDTVRNLSSYVKNVRIRLDDPYTDRDGRTYDNYGTYVMRKFYKQTDGDPKNFYNSWYFLNKVCPGMYAKMESGVGCLAEIYLTQLNVYFSYKDAGKTYHTFATFAGTEEVIQGTQITNDTTRLKEMAADESCTYIKSPAGIFTELTLPIEEIIQYHEEDSINLARLSLQCYNKTSDSDYAISAPENIMMIQKDSLINFFEKSKTVDYRKTHIATYGGTDNDYTFGNIGLLIQAIHDALPDDPTEREQWKKQHPDWNKVLLVPVTTTVSTIGSSSYITSVKNTIMPHSAKLVRSTADNPTIKLGVVYSKFENF